MSCVTWVLEHDVGKDAIVEFLQGNRVTLDNQDTYMAMGPIAYLVFDLLVLGKYADTLEGLYEADPSR